jgi:phosphatidylglycerophosphate synthase
MTTSFKSAERHQQSILAALEKRTLIWLAQRMPASVGPDHLTILGFLGMIFAGVCYYLSRYNPLALFGAIIFLAMNWFGDSLDGTLARVRNKQRPRYGFYVDHVVDTFGALFLIGGLGLSGYMSLAVAAGVLIAYFMLSIEIYLATYTIGVFRLSYGVWGPTELRILLAIGSATLYFKPWVTIAGDRYLLCDVGGAVSIVGLAIVLITSVIRNTATLYDQERIR